MAGRPDSYMPFFIADYRDDTKQLSLCEHGAYLLLLFEYWRKGAALPDNDIILARICSATVTEWDAVTETVRAFFKPAIIDGKRVLTHKRVEQELEKARANYEKRCAASARANQAKAEAAARLRAKSATDTDTESVTAEDTETDTVSVTQPITHNSPSKTQTPSPISQRKEDIKSLISMEKKAGNGTPTIEDPLERLARFQAKLASHLGPPGWEIVCSAADRTDPRHDANLALCKQAAKQLGKGWPKLWGAPPPNRMDTR